MKMKKVIASVGAIAMCGVMGFGLAGCTPPSANQSVELSMNPNVVFMLDANNKVTSVEFKNDDAEKIFVNIDFEGYTLEGAMELFVNYSLISGHINVAGQDVQVTATAATDEKITALANKTENAVKAAFDEVGITATVDKVAQTAQQAHEALVLQVKKLAPEVSTVEIKDMTAEELAAKIDAKQRELAGLTRDQIETIYGKFATGADALLKTAIETANTLYESAKTALENALPGIDTTQLKNALNDKKAAFDEAVAKYIAKFNEFVNQAKAQIETAVEVIKTNFKSDVANKKSDVIAHLNTQVQNENLTEEQAQKIKDLIEKYAPAQA